MAEIKDPENTILMELSGGTVTIELMPDVAPLHTARMKELARAGAYDNVCFHRVIEGFMAQTGDVANGNMEKTSTCALRALVAPILAMLMPNSPNCHIAVAPSAPPVRKTRTLRIRNSSSTLATMISSTANTPSTVRSLKAWITLMPSCAANPPPIPTA